jgi:hypothetical protein
MMKANDEVLRLIEGVKKNAKIPKGFTLWTEPMVLAWLRQNQRRKTKAELASEQRDLWQRAFEHAHEEGVKRHRRYWLSCNTAAVDIMRQFGFDPADLRNKALVSIVILKVLDKRGK